MLWRIYYSDGSTYSSKEGSPESAPPFGVMTIVQEDTNVGRTITHMFDWYYWGLLNRLPCDYLLQGRMTSNITYQKIMKETREDPDFTQCSPSVRRPAPIRGGKVI
jgi:hypothetical protein